MRGRCRKLVVVEWLEKENYGSIVVGVGCVEGGGGCNVGSLG